MIYQGVAGLPREHATREMILATAHPAHPTVKARLGPVGAAAQDDTEITQGVEARANQTRSQRMQMIRPALQIPCLSSGTG